MDLPPHLEGLPLDRMHPTTGGDLNLNLDTLLSGTILMDDGMARIETLRALLRVEVLLMRLIDAQDSDDAPKATRRRSAKSE